MGKFTAGKWEHDTHSIRAITPEETIGIAFMYQPNTKEEAEANARLIVAAPKMYERLKLIARLISRQAQGQLQDSIDPAIADSIYELLAEIDNEPVESMKYSSSFFQNRNCEYFPCHDVKDTERFSCLFCFCPLYHIENCGGNHHTLSNGIKDCSNCTLPHMDYKHVIGVLQQEGKHE